MAKKVKSISDTTVSLEDLEKPKFSQLVNNGKVENSTDLFSLAF